MRDKSAREILTFYGLAIRSSREVTFHLFQQVLNLRAMSSPISSPNSSTGLTSNIEIGEFLVRGGSGPEHQELLRLIGTLVEDQSQPAR